MSGDLMVITTATILRCPTCYYERRVPGMHDPAFLDRRCPACVSPAKWAGWAAGAGAKPVDYGQTQPPTTETKETT